MKRIYAPLVFLAAIFGSSTGRAEPLSELALLHRCYAHLTSVPLPLDHPFRDELANGAGAIDLCVRLLNSVTLGEDGRVPGPAHGEPQKVLATFYDFHRDWFSHGLLDEMQAYNENQSRGTQDLFDTTEPALALTHALFAPSGRYRQIVEGRQGYSALREVDPVVNASHAHPDFLMPSRRYRDSDQYRSRYINFKREGATFRRADASTSSTMPMGETIAVGELIGIVRDSRRLVLPNYSPQIAYTTLPFPGRATANQESAQSTEGMVVPIDILRNHGSGILGFNSFMFVNWGHESGRLQDGAEKMARRWVQAFMNAMTCHDLPYLREIDVQEWVVPSADDDVAPFRTSAGCTVCHATTDQLAAVTRNMVIALSDADYARHNAPDGRAPKPTHLIGRFEASVDVPYAWPARAQPDYHKQTPSGLFMFRSVTGTLVREPISDLNEVGPILAAQPDMYRCAAVRYLEYFTGVEIELYDPGDPQNFSRSDQESIATKLLRRSTELLGDELQRSQSLKSLIVSIMRSDIYRDRNYLQPVETP